MTCGGAGAPASSTACAASDHIGPDDRQRHPTAEPDRLPHARGAGTDDVERAVVLDERAPSTIARAASSACSSWNTGSASAGTGTAGRRSTRPSGLGMCEPAMVAMRSAVTGTSWRRPRSAASASTARQAPAERRGRRDRRVLVGDAGAAPPAPVHGDAAPQHDAGELVRRAPRRRARRPPRPGCSAPPSSAAAASRARRSRSARPRRARTPPRTRRACRGRAGRSGGTRCAGAGGAAGRSRRRRSR